MHVVPVQIARLLKSTRCFSVFWLRSGLFVCSTNLLWLPPISTTSMHFLLLWVKIEVPALLAQDLHRNRPWREEVGCARHSESTVQPACSSWSGLAFAKLGRMHPKKGTRLPVGVRRDSLLRNSTCRFESRWVDPSWRWQVTMKNI